MGPARQSGHYAWLWLVYLAAVISAGFLILKGGEDANGTYGYFARCRLI